MNYGKSATEKTQDAVSAYGKQVTNGIEGAVDTVRDAGHDALAVASDRLDAMRDKAKPAVERMVARGQEIADGAITSTREAGVRAKRAVSGYAHACEAYVVEQPMKSIAIAAAAGATIAALLMLSRSRANERARYNAR
jgi:ElaB/YqjD/DUF883 family membrane-anchored ribosome-binding protein